MILSDNLFTELPDFIGQMFSLERIHLDGNELFCVGSEVDSALVPTFLIDGTIEHVYGLYAQDCED